MKIMKSMRNCLIEYIHFSRYVFELERQLGCWQRWQQQSMQRKRTVIKNIQRPLAFFLQFIPQKMETRIFFITIKLIISGIIFVFFFKNSEHIKISVIEMRAHNVDAHVLFMAELTHKWYTICVAQIFENMRTEFATKLNCVYDHSPIWTFCLFGFVLLIRWNRTRYWWLGWICDFFYSWKFGNFIPWNRITAICVSNDILSCAATRPLRLCVSWC